VQNSRISPRTAAHSALSPFEPITRSSHPATDTPHHHK
jgi:hypothetical protein